MGGSARKKEGQKEVEEADGDEGDNRKRGERKGEEKEILNNRVEWSRKKCYVVKEKEN